MAPLSTLENNCMQITASAAGYSTGATVASACAALLLVKGVHIPWYHLVPFAFFTAMLGVFIAIPMKRQTINHEELPSQRHCGCGDASEPLLGALIAITCTAISLSFKTAH